MEKTKFVKILQTTDNLELLNVCRFLFPGNTAGALQTIKKHQVLPLSKGFKAVKKTRGADIWKT